MEIGCEPLTTKIMQLLGNTKKRITKDKNGKKCSLIRKYRSNTE